MSSEAENSSDAKPASSNMTEEPAARRRRWWLRPRRTEEPHQDHVEGHFQNASNDARPVLNGVRPSAGQGIEANMQKHRLTNAQRERQEGRARSRPTFRVAGPDQFSSEKEQRGGHASSEGHCELLGSSGTTSASPNLRRGAILRWTKCAKQTSR